MNLTIREATPADAVLIADISRQCFYETFAADNTKEDMDKFLAEQFTRGGLILEAGDKTLRFFLAYAGDEVAGYVKLRDGALPPEAKAASGLEIARLYAMPHLIGKGVGKALMQKSIDIARQRQKEIIWLAVWEKNRRAIDFYTAWGFEKFGETDFLLGNDLQTDWLMKRKLGETATAGSLKG